MKRGTQGGIGSKKKKEISKARHGSQNYLSLNFSGQNQLQLMESENEGFKALIKR